MQILITGGTGLIGKQLICRLGNQHQFTVLTRSTSKARQQLPDTGNITLIDNLDALDNFNEFDVIINLAGEPIADKRWTSQQKYQICQSRWQLTTALVSKINASSTPPHTFISGSAIGYYGRQGDKVVTEENTEPHNEFTHEVCERWEKIAETVQQTCRVCLLRTGVVLAAEGGALAKMRLPFKLGLGGPIGSGEQYMSWIHLDDMVNAIEFLLTHPECAGPFNLTAPQPVTNHEFVKAFGNALGRPAIMPMPGFALKLIMGEAADMLLTGQRVIPQKLQGAGFTFKFDSIQSAFADTEG
ncbi:TIGR01777 family oxidoreductase [Alteromonas lipolytica]|uniref:TIGR01777 family protein n=1 Tax=Alteromonas lipolytica TaxID=1856405 RepID=A0A1E8FEJ5_9ALTE|nr:TIGR01777 family oxidoreductase [Alteromonas lipolytica]OFI34355.1 TIGR01777 family protein [Alteromonas lipolytica]GGF82185.1 epimerase [Alteromonas lipolytica]